MASASSSTAAASRYPSHAPYAHRTPSPSSAAQHSRPLDLPPSPSAASALARGAPDAPALPSSSRKRRYDDIGHRARPGGAGDEPDESDELDSAGDRSPIVIKTEPSHPSSPPSEFYRASRDVAASYPFHHHHHRYHPTSSSRNLPPVRGYAGEEDRRSSFSASSTSALGLGLPPPHPSGNGAGALAPAPPPGILNRSGSGSGGSKRRRVTISGAAQREQAEAVARAVGGNHGGLSHDRPHYSSSPQAPNPAYGHHPLPPLPAQAHYTYSHSASATPVSSRTPLPYAPSPYEDEQSRRTRELREQQDLSDERRRLAVGAHDDLRRASDAGLSVSEGGRSAFVGSSPMPHGPTTRTATPPLERLATAASASAMDAFPPPISSALPGLARRRGDVAQAKARKLTIRTSGPPSSSATSFASGTDDPMFAVDHRDRIALEHERTSGFWDGRMMMGGGAKSAPAHKVSFGHPPGLPSSHHGHHSISLAHGGPHGVAYPAHDGRGPGAAIAQNGSGSAPAYHVGYAAQRAAAQASRAAAAVASSQARGGIAVGGVSRSAGASQSSHIIAPVVPGGGLPQPPHTAHSFSSGAHSGSIPALQTSGVVTAAGLSARHALGLGHPNSVLPSPAYHTTTFARQHAHSVVGSSQSHHTAHHTSSSHPSSSNAGMGSWTQAHAEPPRTAVPPHLRSPNSSSLHTANRESFLELFSKFYDSLSDSRTLKATLEDQIKRSTSLLATLEKARRVMEETVERRVREERVVWEGRVRGLEGRVRDLEMRLGGAGASAAGEEVVTDADAGVGGAVAGAGTDMEVDVEGASEAGKDENDGGGGGSKVNEGKSKEKGRAKEGEKKNGSLPLTLDVRNGPARGTTPSRPSASASASGGSAA